MIENAKEADVAIFCFEGDGTCSLKEILSECGDSVRNIAVIVGSEGGFSPEEAHLASENGFKMANLGPRILRCETAPDYALAAISYHFEL
jgi:16S rRNA (uracil1498-N3)-methyltransferase